MNDFFKQRLGQHLKEMSRYLKYVFNDFFVIALMFFVGALGLTYSNFLKTVVPGQWWQRLVIILILVVGLQLCNLATLVKKPDRVFIAPKEYEFKAYLQAAFKYSFLLSFIVQVLVIFILMPFIMVSLNWTLINILELTFLVLILKWMIMKNHLANLYLGFPKSNLTKGLINLLLPCIILVVAFYVSIVAGIFISLLCTICLYLMINKYAKLIDWKYLIATEQRRMSVVYRFFSLFQDVPEVKPKIKRRLWASPLFKLAKQNHSNTFTNLYLRTFIRDGEISSLFFRLTIIGFLVIVFAKNNVISVCIYDLFVYLVGFQLIPFYKVFDDNVFVHIYPINEKMRKANFRLVVRSMLLIELVVLTLGMIIGGIKLNFVVFALIIGLFEVYALTGPYLKNKFKN